jgi:hypothetical protein
MRQMTWIRYGLASVILAAGALGTLAIGCSDDDSSGGTGTDGGSKDAAKDSPIIGNDASEGGGPVDSGRDGEGGPPPAPHGKVIVVHGSQDLYPIRFCFGTGQADDGSDLKVTPIAALPHDDTAQPVSATAPLGPALYAGTGGPLPDLIDLSKVAITGFVINAQKIGPTATGGTNDIKSNANERSCDAMIGATGTNPGTGLTSADIIRLPTIPKGTFASSSTHIVLLNGCLGGNAAGAIKCGPGYLDAGTAGNLNLKITQQDRTTTDGGMGVQFLQGSTPWDGVLSAQSLGTYAGTVAGFADLTPIADGGTAVPISTPLGPVKFPQLTPATAQPNPGLGSRVPQATAFYVRAINGDGGTIANVPLPLNVIQLLSGQHNPQDGGAGSMFADGYNFTFVLLGDPDPTVGQLGGPDGGPAYNGHGVHVIAFSNDPVLGKL